MKLKIWIVFFVSVADMAFTENTFDIPEANVQQITVYRDLRKTKGDLLNLTTRKPRLVRPDPVIQLGTAGELIVSKNMELIRSSAEVSRENSQSDNTVENAPVTFYTIKKKLKASGVFDWNSPSLSKEDRKQLKGLRRTIEIMMTSRARQPSNVQNTFTSLRNIQRIVKKLAADGQISESLANKFNWQNVSNV